MKQIVVIGSLHEEKKNTNISSLFKIIDSIEPDVIFEEIPIDLFEDIYLDKRNDDGLEVGAVKKYLSSKNIPHYAIDIPCLPIIAQQSEINKIENSVDQYFTSINNNKVNKYNKIINDLENNGFESINSKKYMNITNKLLREKSRNLYHFYRKMYYANKYENDFHFTLREDYMVHQIANNILEYKNSILLVGSMHLSSIIRKLKYQFPRYNINFYTKN